MFDRTFFNFALGFLAIIAVSLGILYLLGNLDAPAGGSTDSAQTVGR